ncbi:hypothetical protein ACFL9U_06470 [Thermodesulfobacteriota bacterium]
MFFYAGRLNKILVRIDAPCTLYHIIVKNIELRNIFEDEIDRINFLDRLGRMLAETGLQAHIHFKSDERNLEDFGFVERVLTAGSNCVQRAVRMASENRCSLLD